MTTIAKDFAWLAFAWVALAVGLVGAVWVVAMATGAAPLPACGGRPGPFGVPLNLGTAVTVALVGSTAFVGGYAAIGAGRWPVRLALLGIVAVLSIAFATTLAPICFSLGG